MNDKGYKGNLLVGSLMCDSGKLMFQCTTKSRLSPLCPCTSAFTYFTTSSTARQPPPIKYHSHHQSTTSSATFTSAVYLAQ